MNGEFVIFVTAPNKEEATRIADTLVKERLAACVNLIAGIESVYQWEGKLVTDSEVLLIIKSTEERFADIERRLRDLHSYTTPEVIALRIEKGSPAYLQWLRESVSPIDNQAGQLKQE